MKVSLNILPFQLNDKYAIKFLFNYVIKDNYGALIKFDTDYATDNLAAQILQANSNVYKQMLFSNGAVGTKKINAFSEVTYFDTQAECENAIVTIKSMYALENIIDPYTMLPLGLIIDDITNSGGSSSGGSSGGTTTIVNNYGATQWKTATAYKLNDLVVYMNSLYLCLSAHTSSTFATEKSNWKRIDADKIPEQWITNKSYSKDDLIVNNDTIYLCITAHQSSTFSTDIANWKEVGAGKSIVSWEANKLYDVNDIIINNSALYICTVKHTSTTFAKDIANWKQVGSSKGIEAWAASTQYKVNDFVVYNGILYQSAALHVSTTFTSDYTKKYWKQVQYKEDGINLPPWESGKAYSINDFVVYAGKTYLCISAHTSNMFSSDTANWKEIGTASSAQGMSQWATAKVYSIDQPVLYNKELYICAANHTSATFSTDEKAGDWYKIGGITDLKSFTTNDLNDYKDKRYVTDAEKANMSKLASIAADQITNNNAIAAINAKIPSDASSSNKLISDSTLTTKLNTISFATLKDTNKPLLANAFVHVDSTGSKLEYLTSIDKYTNIKKITDKAAKEYFSVPYLTFKDFSGNTLSDGTLELTLKDLFSTNLKDMPTTYDNGKVLVANKDKMLYELKAVSDLTNSHANFSTVIDSTNWTAAGTSAQALVEHKLNSKNLIVSFYDTDDNSITLPYKIIDANQILVTSANTNPTKVVINCSQGVEGTGTVGTNTSVTASDFIDDNRARLDKTYSSTKIEATLSQNYMQKANTYTKAESDAKFSEKGLEHTHANFTTLTKFSEDAAGNIMYNGKNLLSKIEPFFYEQHWNGQTNAALDMVINIADVMQSKSFITINSSEFTIKNLISATGTATDKENTLKLQVIDSNIIVLDVDILPQEVQKYVLGISPNIKIFVQGQFDANYYLTAF